MVRGLITVALVPVAIAVAACGGDDGDGGDDTGESRAQQPATVKVESARVWFDPYGTGDSLVKDADGCEVRGTVSNRFTKEHPHHIGTTALLSHRALHDERPVFTGPSE
jgi:hypothetical protein